MSQPKKVEVNYDLNVHFVLHDQVQFDYNITSPSLQTATFNLGEAGLLDVKLSCI